mmetsp:Transcript_16198/g.41584  ORF Transcript_16198/g.41584 Transcript_16198/m.41584 type:complete len:625 (-) Transcript_16198:81-1955(-)
MATTTASQPPPAKHTASQPVRLLFCGVFDILHVGHLRAFQSVKALSPSTILVAAVWGDSTLSSCKMDAVLNEKERHEALTHCKYVDEVLEKPLPSKLTLSFLLSHKIDYVTSMSELDSLSDPYEEVAENGMFITLKGTFMSTSEVVLRVVQDYDSHVRMFLSMGLDPKKDINLSVLREKRIVYSEKLDSLKRKWSDQIEGFKDKMRELPKKIRTGGIVGDFTRKFGGWWLRYWTRLAFMKRDALHRIKHSRVTYPSQDATLEPLSGSSDEMGEMVASALNICKSIVPGWDDVSMANFSISVIKGGLTNRLFKCSVTNTTKDPTAVLLRCYGGDLFFDRDRESTIFKIFSESAFGPRLFGFFEDGRIEQFLAARTLQNIDLPGLSPLIAKKTAQMHSFDMPFQKTPSLFATIRSWFAQASHIAFPEDARKQDLLDSLNVAGLRGEIEWLERLLQHTPSPTVFCHNDLQMGNIMYDEATDRVVFIDYEYGSYNYRGYEFGNHFCEWMFDYQVPDFPGFSYTPTFYPSKSRQEIFFRNYLVSCGSRKGKSADPLGVSQQQLDDLYAETSRYALASHFLWGLWSVIQSASSDIEFGFLEYGKVRLQEYFARKDAAAALPISVSTLQST